MNEVPPKGETWNVPSSQSLRFLQERRVVFRLNAGKFSSIVFEKQSFDLPGLPSWDLPAKTALTCSMVTWGAGCVFASGVEVRSGSPASAR